MSRHDSLQGVNVMKIIKVNNYEQMSQRAAEIVLETVQEIAQPVLRLPTGSTQERLYELLVRTHQTEHVSFKNVRTFNLDEYVGLPVDSDQSYHYFMNEHLFRHLDIPENHIYIPNGQVENLEQECAAYETYIKQVGPVDLQVLGLGVNGHIGFNEPGTRFNERTHIVELEDSTSEANARFFKSKEDVPKLAVTMGIETILEAKRILLLVQGEKKAEILRKVIHEEMTEDIPASVLQRHANVTVITDIEI